jgi:small subunit ribosomal protein S2
MLGDSYKSLSKRERLQIQRERAKLEKNLGSIADLSRLPSAIFVVDILKEHIAVAEAGRLNIPTFAIVDTNSNPKLVDYPIPANDDASKSIAVIVKTICAAIAEGLEERKLAQDKEDEEDMDEQRDSKAIRMKDEEDVDDAKEEKTVAIKKAKATPGEKPAEGEKRKRTRKPISTPKKVTKK